MNKIFGQPWYFWLVIALAIGYFIYPPEQVMVNNLMSQFIGQQQGLTPVTVTTMTPNNPVTPYTGPISLTLNSLWAWDGTTLALTNAAYMVYHHDLTSYAVNGMTLSSSTTVTQSTGDNGILYIAVLYKTMTVGFVDPDLTLKNNKPYITGYMLRDLAASPGQKSIIFTLDVSSFVPLAPGATQAIPQAVNVNLYSWKNQAGAMTITAAGTAPTGMTTAGEYHSIGYLTGWTAEGYELRLVNVEVGTSNAASTSVTANATIGGLFAAGTLQMHQMSIRGSGPQTGTLYGAQWTAPSYSPGVNYFLLYSANHNGVTDTSQVNYGLPYPYERNAGASWMGYDIWWTTSAGALTAGSKYYAIIYLTFLQPDASIINAYLVITLTG